MIKAIIIDDEPACVSILQHDLAAICPEIQVLATCLSAKDGLLAIRKFQPDLIFLDIEMPWMNGLELLEALGQELSFQLIFTTAYDQFAARAFRLSAVDYLLKPIDRQQLRMAVDKVKANTHRRQSEQVNNLLYNHRQPKSAQRIALPNRDGHEFVEVQEIVYCQADGPYTYIHLIDNRRILLSKSLGEVEHLLTDELFLRIHHSTLVNVERIYQLIRRDGTYVMMRNGEKLTVARSKKDLLLSRLGLSS